MVLTRHWATHLTFPLFVVDADGDLVYFNESAEPILGRRFHETDVMPKDEWSTRFNFTDEQGLPIKPDEVPLAIVLKEQRPVHRRLYLQGMDSVVRCIRTTCLPLVDQANQLSGAIALFWEIDE